jgi:hypothetical protein
LKIDGLASHSEGAKSDKAKKYRLKALYSQRFMATIQESVAIFINSNEVS